MVSRKYLKFLLVASFLVLLVVPHRVSAVSWFPLVPCGLNQQPKDSSGVEIPKSVHDYTEDCNQCLLIELGSNVIDMTFFAIVPSVGTLMFLIAGFFILFGARNGKGAEIAKGQQIMKDTAIGIAIIMASWLIANFILKSIANPEVAKTEWWHVECTTGSLLDITLGATSGGTGTGTQKYSCSSSNQCAPDPNGQYTTSTCDGNCQAAPPPPVPPPGGAQCPQSALPLCQGDGSQGCANTNCAQYAGMINSEAVGYASPNILKAFMEVESSCDIRATTATSYGLMQLKPSTANIYASRCDVTAGSVDSAWLLDPANAKSSICIAVQYINAIAVSQCGNAIRNVYAGYNGGEAGSGSSCAPSANCANDTSCSNEKVKRWECLYEDDAHTVCNTGYDETRKGATRVQFCATNPGF